MRPQNLYEQQIARELGKWKRKMSKSPTLTDKMAKKAQAKINSLIPEKVHKAITASIREMVRVMLTGADFTAPFVSGVLSLEERENLILKKISAYKKTAAAEGGITGFGGIVMGLADFPLLLGIKLKLLNDIAATYGRDLSDFKERIYLLRIFELAFSSREKRQDVFTIIQNWNKEKENLPPDISSFDWRSFQQEYRDHIDLAKMAQLLPVIGAAVGLVVNYRLVNRLGETAMNAYRMRWLEDPPPERIEEIK